MTATALVDHALAYAKRGMRVLPLWSVTDDGRCECGMAPGECKPGKHPDGKLVEHGLTDATTDTETIRSWWTKHPTANIGIATGQSSGIVVVDIDSREAREALFALEAEHGDLPPTVISNTGRGHHLVFRHPGVPVTNHTAVAGIKGLDIRGDGGYIVAPPSRHASGKPYSWALPPGDIKVPMASLPPWFLALVNGQNGNGNGTPKARIEPAGILEGVPEGQRDDALFRFACQLRGARIPEGAARHLVEQAARNCQPPFPIDAAAEKVNRAYRRYPEGSAVAPASTSSSLVDLDVAGLLARGGWEPVPVLDDFLWDKTFTYLSGASGSFKTWLMVTWAVALAMNKPFIRQAVHGEHRILFVECESSVQILQRLPRVCAAYDVALDDVLKRLRFMVPEGRALRLENPAEAAHVMQLAKDHGATWVFIDSLRRVTGLNENFAEDMARLADTAFLPLRDDGHNVLLLEHPAKPMQGVSRNRKEAMRGSGDKSAAADVVLHVDALETEQGRVAALSVAKCRFAPERDEPLFMRLRLTGEAEGLGFEEVEEPAEARQGRKPARLEQAKNVIAAERGRTPGLTYTQAIRACIGAGLSKSTAQRALKELPKVQGSEGSKLGSECESGFRVQKVHTPVGGEP